MLGAIVGDVVGSVYEFNDDTILTIATADALMTDMDFASKYRSYGARYPPSYGGFFRRWIYDENAIRNEALGRLDSEMLETYHRFIK